MQWWESNSWCCTCSRWALYYQSYIPSPFPGFLHGKITTEFTILAFFKCRVENATLSTTQNPLSFPWWNSAPFELYFPIIPSQLPQPHSTPVSGNMMPLCVISLSYSASCHMFTYSELCIEFSDSKNLETTKCRWKKPNDKQILSVFMVSKISAKELESWPIS